MITSWKSIIILDEVGTPAAIHFGSLLSVKTNSFSSSGPKRSSSDPSDAFRRPTGWLIQLWLVNLSSADRRQAGVRRQILNTVMFSLPSFLWCVQTLQGNRVLTWGSAECWCLLCRFKVVFSAQCEPFESGCEKTAVLDHVLLIVFVPMKANRLEAQQPRSVYQTKFVSWNGPLFIFHLKRPSSVFLSMSMFLEKGRRFYCNSLIPAVQSSMYPCGEWQAPGSRRSTLNITSIHTASSSAYWRIYGVVNFFKVETRPTSCQRKQPTCRVQTCNWNHHICVGRFTNVIFVSSKSLFNNF